MLIAPNSYLYAYAITRDFGFAPNPFHGFCTLATCKPNIRKGAKAGDWVMGVGGSVLRAVKRKCIFLMEVSESLSFEEYWNDARFVHKKPCRNGSRVQMLGDNIYHKDDGGGWIQEDSHHSNPDGTPNLVNLNRDTGRCDQVLVSDHFYYFGHEAIELNLDSIGYGRIRDMKKIDLSSSTEGRDLITSICTQNRSNRNMVTADPCQFQSSHQRVDQGTGKIV